MSAVFQGLVNLADGRVQIDIRPTAVRPADTINFRGLAVSSAGEVYCLVDTGQSRVFQAGIAFEAATGLLLVSQKDVANISMGGLAVDADGALPYKTTVEVVHQGVGLSMAGNVCIETAG